MAADTNDGGTLEQRLRLIEDRFEIYNLIASHPPSADTGAGDYTASVWTEDGVFDRGAEFPRSTADMATPGLSNWQPSSFRIIPTHRCWMRDLHDPSARAGLPPQFRCESAVHPAPG